jgi:hypothetical protein
MFPRLELFERCCRVVLARESNEPCPQKDVGHSVPLVRHRLHQFAIHQPSCCLLDAPASRATARASHLHPGPRRPCRRRTRMTATRQGSTSVSDVHAGAEKRLLLADAHGRMATPVRRSCSYTKQANTASYIGRALACRAFHGCLSRPWDPQTEVVTVSPAVQCGPIRTHPG